MGRARRIYTARTGWIEIGGSTEVEAPFVHQDTLKNPLRHPVTEEVCDSLSRYNAINRELGLKVVGNDLFSKKPRNLPDRIGEDMILDRIERAEAIHSDPAKFREYENRNLERLERREKLLHGSRR